MNISIKESGEVSFTVDIHNMKGECLENCILLNVGDMLSLRFKTLNELKSLVRQDTIKFDSSREAEVFKEKIATVIKKIEIEYGDI